MRHVMFVAVMLSLASPATAGTGDVNNDTKVTVADAVLALKIAGGMLKPTTAQQFAADVVPDAPDGSVRIADAIRIARIAAGVDPKMPSSSIPVTLSLTVSGSGTRNFTMAGGHSVAGKLTDSAGAVFAGGIAFADTTTGAVYGPWPLDTTTGAFFGVLPTGKYQPIAVTHFSTEPTLGEFENTDIPVAVGTTLSVSAPLSGLNLTRGAVPVTSKLTVTYTGTLPPYGRTNTVYFTDTGATASSFGLNKVVRDIVNPPGAIGMPNGTYSVESVSQYALSSGLYEDLSILYHQTLTVTGARSTTLAYPKLYELAGVISPPALYPTVSIYGEYQPTGAADAVAGLVRTGSADDYLLALVPGFHYLTIGLTGLTADTWSTDIDFVIPYTMPAAPTTKNFTLPAPPAFRTITGVVRTPAGGIAASVSIKTKVGLATVPAAGAYVFTGHAVTDANGAYTLTLPDGAYTLTATP